VGAAVLRDGRLLACRRTAPPEVAGGWELPGGKVEPGESPEAALVREVAEELGIAITVTGWLDGSSPIADTHVLTVATARVTRWTPRPVEHDRLRWLGHAELDDVPWLPADRPFLAQLGRILQR
jgi:8-oxo-dGTP diphosphatase